MPGEWRKSALFGRFLDFEVPARRRRRGPALMEAMAATRRVLEDAFGFSGFRPDQEAAIGELLAGRYALVVMPIGAGRSSPGFQLPPLRRPPKRSSARTSLEKVIRGLALSGADAGLCP